MKTKGAQKKNHKPKAVKGGVIEGTPEPGGKDQRTAAEGGVIQGDPGPGGQGKKAAKKAAGR